MVKGFSLYLRGLKIAYHKTHIQEAPTTAGALLMPPYTKN